MKIHYLVCATVLTLGGLVLAAGQDGKNNSSRPWWQMQKIRFFWGHWNALDEANVPIEETMKNLRQVGATVFVENLGPGVKQREITQEGGVYYHLGTAGAAQKYGIHYFASIFAYNLPTFADKLKAQPSVNEEGKPYGLGSTIFPCPLNKPLYHQWFLKPVLKLAKTGVVDGLHMDWERYGGMGEAGICYCTQCFKAFQKMRGKAQTLPKAEERYGWLQQHNLLGEYTKTFQRRRTEMFEGFADAVHKAHPTFVFSGYYMYGHKDIANAFNSPEVPYFMVDSRHYYEDGTRPWWDSTDGYYRSLGFRRIAGTYDNKFFGGQPDSHVSINQWLYDAAMHSDGYWFWFESEFFPDAWRGFWIAEHRIRAVEAKVGHYLLQGKSDMHFVTPVEWTGSPELARKIKHVSYHLGDEHLVHVNNVDTDRSVQVRLRFNRLSAAGTWTVRDPISGLYYSPDGETTLWGSSSLLNGIVVSLEKRTDLFLLLSPQTQPLRGDRGHLLVSQEIRPMADHPKTTRDEARSVTTGGNDCLAYLVTQPLGYRGGQGGWGIGNAIFSVDANGQHNKRLYGLKGYLWEPRWSPDGERIAFSCYTNGRGQIFVVSADGSGLMNISNNAYCDRSPSWSPDGTKIAFASDRDGDWEIYVMKADGSLQKRLTESPGLDSSPIWSPMSSYIAFESDRGIDQDIFVVKDDGSDLRSVTGTPGLEMDLAWSPDGKYIVCSGSGLAKGRRLLIASLSGEVSTVFRYAGRLTSPCWSPDGKYIAVAFRYGAGWGDKSGIIVISPDETNKHMKDLINQNKAPVLKGAIRPHPTGPLRDYIPAKPTPTWYSSGSGSPRWVHRTFGGLSWSLDSKHLAFSSDMDDGYFYVYTISPEGGKPMRLDVTRSAWLQEISWCPK